VTELENRNYQKEIKMTENISYPNAILPNMVVSHNLELCVFPTETFFAKEAICTALMHP